MNRIKSCFILEDGQYIEVPMEEVLENGSYRHNFPGRYFYPFGNYLLEMSREDRRFFYDCQESMAHMVKPPKRQAKLGQLIRVESLEELMESVGDGNSRLDFLFAQEDDPAEQVERDILKDSIRTYRKRISAQEDRLLMACFEEGVSDRMLAKQLHVSQSTITKRRKRILGKLLNFLKTE